MRKSLMSVAVAAVAVLWLSGPALAGCPCQIKGAEKTVTNTADGVTITITAKDPVVVKQIQEAAAKMKEGGCEKCAKKGKCTGKADCKCKKCADKHKGAKPEEKKEEPKGEKK